MKTEQDIHLKQLQELNKNIEVVISLLLRIVSRDNNALLLKDQITILDSLGVRPTSMAAILGKTTGHVTKELVGIRRSSKKKK